MKCELGKREGGGGSLLPNNLSLVTQGKLSATMRVKKADTGFRAGEGGGEFFRGGGGYSVRRGASNEKSCSSRLHLSSSFRFELLHGHISAHDAIPEHKQRL